MKSSKAEIHMLFYKGKRCKVIPLFCFINGGERFDGIIYFEYLCNSPQNLHPINPQSTTAFILIYRTTSTFSWPTNISSWDFYTKALLEPLTTTPKLSASIIKKPRTAIYWSTTKIVQFRHLPL